MLLPSQRSGPPLQSVLPDSRCGSSGKTKELKRPGRATLHDHPQRQEGCECLSTSSSPSSPLSPTRTLSQETEEGRGLRGYLESCLEQDGRQPKDGFPELHHGTDLRVPAPWPLPPAISCPLAIFSPEVELTPDPLCLPLPWTSDPDSLFPDLVPGRHSMPGTH